MTHRVALFAAGVDVDAVFGVWSQWRSEAVPGDHLHLIVVGGSIPVAGLHPLSDELRAAWPVQAPGWHGFTTDGGRVHWLVGLDAGHRPAVPRQLIVSADVVHAAAPLSDVADSSYWARGLARVAAIGARLTVSGDDDSHRHALQSAGWRLDAEGPPTKAVYAPRRSVRQRRANRGIGSGGADEPVLIVGGGLAGCAAAASLAALGRRSTVLDRSAAPASGASGNPAALFHGVVTPDDGKHARWYRAAALLAGSRIGAAIAAGETRGAVCGVLRLQDVLGAHGPHGAAGWQASPSEAAASVLITWTAMQSVLQRLALPAAYVQAVDASTASALAGVTVSGPAWWYPGGGWVDPAGWCRALLRSAGGLVQWQGGASVDRLERTATGWTVLDADGAPLASASTVVLANAGDALRLAGNGHWPVQAVRGQLSIAAQASDAADPAPRVALTGAGYVLPPIDGQLVFGATSQPDDDDPQVRAADHAENLVRLQQLLGRVAGPGAANVDAASLTGRTAWRWLAHDRLPIVGAVPDSAAITGRAPDQARHVPRRTGLYMLTALGGRGVTSASLAGDLLAALIVGTPLPLAADLVDAVDPARFIARTARRNGSGHAC